MKIKKILSFLLLFTILFTGCDTKDGIDESIVATQQDIKVQTFKLQQIDGNFITVSYDTQTQKWSFDEYPNKVVLLTFFASWCPPCKAEIPHLNNLVDKYKDEFIVLGISVEQDKDNNFYKDFIKQYKINYPVTNGTQNFYLANAVGGVSSIPAMFMIDKKGKMVRNYVGAVHEEILDNDIKKFKGN